MTMKKKGQKMIEVAEEEETENQRRPLERVLMITEPGDSQKGRAQRLGGRKRSNPAKARAPTVGTKQGPDSLVRSIQRSLQQRRELPLGAVTGAAPLARGAAVQPHRTKRCTSS